MWREFRGLDHGPVAGPENVRQWTEDHVDGHIPGCHHPDHPFGLVFDVGSGAKEVHRQEGGAFLRLHPLLQVFLDEFQATHRIHNVHHQGGVF